MNSVQSTGHTQSMKKDTQFEVGCDYKMLNEIYYLATSSQVVPSLN